MESEGPIAILSPRLNERQQMLTDLVVAALSAGMSLALIAQKGGPRTSDCLMLRRDHRWRLYSLSAVEDAEAFVAVMVSVRYWHKSPFVVVLGAPGLPEELAHSNVSLAASIPDMSKQLDTEVFGYLYPMDDELEVHGDKRVANLLKLK